MRVSNKLIILLLLMLLIPFLKGVSGVYENSKPNIHYQSFDFDCPLINDANVNIIPSTCNSPDGKILGIRATGTGTLHFTWFDSEKTIVGTEPDLINVPPGIYYFELRDDSKCKTVISTKYTVGQKDAVVFDNTHTVISNSSCNASDGSITNIGITNAVKYKWTDATNTTIATTADLKNASSGVYSLTATNSTGCSNTTSYTLNSNTYFPPLLKVDTIAPQCPGVGGFTLTFDIKETDVVYSYSLFEDGNSQPVKNGLLAYNSTNVINSQLIFNNLGSDVPYTLILSNPDNCIKKFALRLKAFHFKIDDSEIVIHNDYCGQHIGTILGLKAIGLSMPILLGFNPYTWRDDAGKIVGGNVFLAGVAAGTYTLTVTDRLGCVTSKSFTIRDSTNVSTPPVVDNIKICLPGIALLTVIKPDTGAFNLYDSTETFVSGNKFGVFPVNVKSTSVYYVTHTNGTCESSKTKVIVTVSLPGISIPNTFTPNSDGINDLWNITGIEQYPNTEVNIFNKTGQLIYHSLGYGRPFDGRYKGKVLPPDVYYYTLDTKKIECTGQISGSLTIIR